MKTKRNINLKAAFKKIEGCQQQFFDGLITIEELENKIEEIAKEYFKQKLIAKEK